MADISSRLGAVGIDCEDPSRLGSFWQQALGYEAQAFGDDYVFLTDPKGSGVEVFVQRVPEPRVAKNRLHIDLYAPDEEAEAARLEGLGARRLRKFTQHGTWIVMADPEGNEFCVCRQEG